MIKIGSHFSGVGTLNEVLKNNKFFQVEYSIENDQHCRKIYKNLFNTKHFFKDIRKIKLDELPTVDLIFSSFPCQAFSKAGKKKALKDDRGLLLLETLRIIEFQRPKVVVFENVDNFISVDNGNVFKFLKMYLKLLGYKFNYKILNSVNFNIPQNRKRFFLVAYDKNEAVNFYFPRAQKLTKKVNDLLEENPAGVRTIKSSDCIKLFPIKNNLIKKTHVRKTYNFNAFKHIARPHIAPTLVCSNDHFFEIEGVFRNLSVKERFRLQGFEDETIDKILNLDISKTQLEKISGNMITANVLQALFKQVEKLFLKFENQSFTSLHKNNETYFYNYFVSNFKKSKKNKMNFDDLISLKDKQKAAANYANKKQQENKRNQILKTIEMLKKTGQKITIYKIAKLSKTSRNTVKKYLKE